jgi:hypothetical protein
MAAGLGKTNGIMMTAPGDAGLRGNIVFYKHIVSTGRTR